MEKAGNISAEICLDTLFYAYLESCGGDRESIKVLYRELDREMEDFPFPRRDGVECVVNRIRADAERRAFRDGVSLGFRLALYLLE